MAKNKYLELHHINIGALEQELQFRTTRSSGKGGQNVNKVSSKVILIFNIDQSKVLNTDQKKVIAGMLYNRINLNNELLVTVSEERSQFQNKQRAVDKFLSLLNMCFKPVIERKDTKPSRSSIEVRLQKKAIQSVKKQLRTWNHKDED